MIYLGYSDKDELDGVNEMKDLQLEEFESEELKPTVNISSDEMEATIYLPYRLDNSYTAEDIQQALVEAGVTNGIKEDAIQKIVKHQICNQTIIIASGEKDVPGVDGYFDYNFNCVCDNKPKVLPDGSVDYWSIHNVETVVEGQVIAVYHPATQGKDGITVRGRVLSAKRGRELPPLKGKGFERDNDNLTYVASLTGKIEMQGERIQILPVYEIFGNAELVNGNIDFKGDLLIHGNIEAGIKIRTTGNLTVDGIVEACDIEAKKEVTLRSGMLGGSIKAGASISAKFFENTIVEAGENITADAFVNSKVTAGKRICVSGKRGKIIGGSIYAVEGIEATDIGNDAEIATSVTVGIGREISIRIGEYIKRIEDTTALLDKIQGALKKFETLEKERGVSFREDPRRISLLRERIRAEATLTADKTELKRMEHDVERSQNATVRVLNSIYPGVDVGIDSMKVRVKEQQERVDFIKRSGKIIMSRIDGEDVV